MKTHPIEIYNARAAQSDYCRLYEIPEHFIKCIIAAEDCRFFEHRGIDHTAIKMSIRSFLKGGKLYGCSTISQQLVKNLYFSFERSWIHKLQEAVMVKKFERDLSKEQILELYINIVYYDNGQYGLSNASQFYFGKKPKDLTVNQSVVIAYVLPVVGVYNPLYHPEEYWTFRNNKIDYLHSLIGLPEDIVAASKRHRADCLDEELCKATKDTDQYNKPGPLINERFGPGMPDCLIR